MIYDEVRHWNGRKRPNAKITQKVLNDYPIRIMRGFTRGSKKILDFGPGVGRIFPAFSDATYVEGFDISSSWVKKVKAAAKKQNFKFKLTIAKSIGHLPYKDNEFDVVVAMSVLLHQRPINVTKVMRELVRVGKKVAVGSYMNNTKPFDRGARADKKKYNHNYIEICKENDWKMSKIINGTTKVSVYFMYWK